MTGVRHIKSLEAALELAESLDHAASATLAEVGEGPLRPDEGADTPQLLAMRTLIAGTVPPAMASRSCTANGPEVLSADG